MRFAIPPPKLTRPRGPLRDDGYVFLECLGVLSYEYGAT
jgi:hypothetical protein